MILWLHTPKVGVFTILNISKIEIIITGIFACFFFSDLHREFYDEPTKQLQYTTKASHPGGVHHFLNNKKRETKAAFTTQSITQPHN